MSGQAAMQATRRGGIYLVKVLVAIIAVPIGVVVGFYVLMPDDDSLSKSRIARYQVHSLTRAAETYKQNNGAYPASLEALALPQPNGGLSIVLPDSLLDPWGQPYSYDAAGPNNDGLKPDIWCTRPDKDIGNWPANKRRPFGLWRKGD